MENYPINIAKDYLPWNYRINFCTKLISYVYDSAMDNVTKDLDNLMKSAGIYGFIHNGNSYTSSKIEKYSYINRSILVKPEHIAIADILCEKDTNLIKLWQETYAITCKALALCKSIGDIKAMFPQDIYDTCKLDYVDSIEINQRYITDQEIDSFTKANPNYFSGIKEQLLTNILIF
jgi:hypothetical protein